MVGPTQQTGYVGTPATTVPVPTDAPSGVRRPPEPVPIVEPEPVLDKRSLVDEVQSLNKLLRGINSRLEFDVYEGTDQLFVQIVDRETREVVGTRPPEEMLQLKAKINQAVGAIIDEFV